MEDWIKYILNLLSYSDLNYLLTDVLFFTNTVCLFAVVSFFFSYRQPFLLLLYLEIIYLCLNINFALSWILTSFDLGLVYILIILGVTAAETVIGLVFVIFLAKLHWMTVSNISKLK